MAVLTILNTVLILLLATVTYVMIRQIALIALRVGPGGYREDNAGPRIGENISALGLDGCAEIIAGKPMTVMIFGSTACYTCKTIKDGLGAVAKAWKDVANVIYLNDESGPEGAARHNGEYIVRYDGRELRARLSVSFVPFGLVVDAASVVKRKGMVNHPSHVENLLEMAQEKR
jgi:hypothetical protein